MQHLFVKVPSPRPGAAPHPLVLTPPIERVGGLSWWIFRNCDTTPENLIEAAIQAGFPTIFLPLPFPVAPVVAFRRGLDRSCSSTSGQPREWQYNLVLRPASEVAPDVTDSKCYRAVKRLRKNYQVPSEILNEIKLNPCKLAVAVAQRWEPSSDRPQGPWLVRLWSAMRCNEAALTLPLDEVLTVVQVVPGSASDDMENRLRKKIERMRTHSAAAEIGDGVMDALMEVGGVKLRPGLFSVPGELGIARGEATLEYLRALGHTEAGMYDLYDQADGAERAGWHGLVPASLREKIEGCLEQAGQLDANKVGVIALRTRWSEVEDLQRALRLNEGLLAGESADLSAELAKVRQILQGKAGEVGQRLGHEVVLAPPLDPKALAHLWTGLLQMEEALRAEAVAAKDLEKAGQELLAGQKTLRQLRLRLLVRRLRKLAAATAHALQDGVHTSPRGKEMFIQALTGAVAYVRALVPESETP